jgi:hypothetical protein
MIWGLFNFFDSEIATIYLTYVSEDSSKSVLNRQRLYQRLSQDFSCVNGRLAELKREKGVKEDLKPSFLAFHPRTSYNYNEELKKLFIIHHLKP